MLTTLARAGSYIAGIGVRPNTPDELRTRIGFSNFAAASILALCIPFIPIHVLTGGGLRAGMLYVEMIVLAVVLLLNARGYVLAGRWLLLLTMNVSVAAVASTAGPDSLIWVCFVAVAVISPLTFTRRERGHAWLGMALPMILGILGYAGVLGSLGAMSGEPEFPLVAEAGIVIGTILIPPAFIFWQAASKDARVAELNAARGELTLEVRRAEALARELAVRSEEAAAASEAKSRFLAHMSHEIRTPLAAVISLMALASESEDPVERRETLETAGASANHLLRILNDILDLSKVEHGNLDLEITPFDLAELVADVVRLTRVRIQRPGLALAQSVQLEGSEWRLGDPLRLKQVLLNLTSNAVKFTPRGQIEVVVREDGGRVHFAVHDTGAGMTEAQLERVFEAFQQADPTIHRTHGGTGLGLTISSQLVAAMGGSLDAQSAPGRGTTFRFSLGLLETDRPDTIVTDDAKPVVGLPLRVLVAEDNAVNAMIARRMLEGLGHEVELVADGKQAVGRAFDGFDAIIMDMLMPNLDGPGATRQIREREAHQGRSPLPIIALTANATDDDRARCLAAGMSGYLTKPLDLLEASHLLAALSAERGT